MVKVKEMSKNNILFVIVIALIVVLSALYLTKDEPPRSIKSSTNCAAGDMDCFENVHLARISENKKVTTLFEKGKKALEEGQLDEAIGAFKKHLQMKPDSFVAYNLLGLAYYQKKEYVKAIKAYKKSVKYEPAYACVYANIGHIYQELNNYDKAIEYYEKSQHYAPNNSLPVYYAGRAYVQKGDLVNALKYLTRAVEMPDPSAEYFLDLGLLYDDLNNMSIDTINKAIELKPDYYEAYNTLGVIYQNKKDFENAISIYMKALEVNPDGYETYNNLGNLYLELKIYDVSAYNYNKGIIINPNFPPLHNNLGLLYLKIKDYEKAEKEFNRALELSPDYEDAKDNLRILNEKTGSSKV